MALRRVDSVSRRRLTAQERQRLLTRYHRGQFTQRAFAEREGIGLSTLIKWLQQERATGQVPVSFQELVVPSSSGRWVLEVVSPRGWTVRLAQFSDGPGLAGLLSALPC